MSQRPPSFRTGDVLPGTKYRVVKELGAGGMGVVYQIVKPPQIQGVLKLMGAELAHSEEFRTRFFDEVRILAQLDHPNIVRVFDYDSLTDGTPYYVMELLQGRTLRDVLTTMGTLPPRVAFEITRQLLEALHCAHTHDVTVVHRDIKPENIFLHAPRHGEPVLKLIDFGVIAVADRKHDGMFVGTWRYAAPEQIRGERATPATDLYAVGLVLYEMLAGRGPFDHFDTGTLVSQAHLQEIPAPVSDVAPWVPPSIVALVASALAKDPQKRPRDALAFADRLYELEVADDGKDPADEGPAPEKPLARVLSSVGGARPIPELGVPDEVRHRGPTVVGVGVGVGVGVTPRAAPNETTPGEDALLDGLAPRAPSGGAMSPRMPEAQLLAAPARVPGTFDTFASQQSDARAVKRGGGLALPLALAAFAAVGAIVAVLVVMSQRQERHEAVDVAAAPPPPVAPPAPVPGPAASASAERPPAATTSTPAAEVTAVPAPQAARPARAVRASGAGAVATGAAARPSSGAPPTARAPDAPAPPKSERDDFIRGGP